MVLKKEAACLIFPYILLRLLFLVKIEQVVCRVNEEREPKVVEEQKCQEFIKDKQQQHLLSFHQSNFHLESCFCYWNDLFFALACMTQQKNNDGKQKQTH